VIPAENPPLAIRRNAEDLDHAWHFETKKTVWSVRNSLATPHETSILHDEREKIVYAQCVRSTGGVIIHHPDEDSIADHGRLGNWPKTCIRVIQQGR
jgi:hypothetical protein